MTRKNIFIVVGMVVVAIAVILANVFLLKDSGIVVTTEAIKSRDLEAIVSASGKIQPKQLVNISAETAGRVVELAVNTIGDLDVLHARKHEERCRRGVLVDDTNGLAQRAKRECHRELRTDRVAVGA